jgi:hypothetical protein
MRDQPTGYFTQFSDLFMDWAESWKDPVAQQRYKRMKRADFLLLAPAGALELLGDPDGRPVPLGQLPDEERAPARRLLLQPLARVALVDARGLRELRGRERAFVGERPVELEDVAEIDGEQIERADRVHEQALDERVASFGGIGRGCHSENLLWGACPTIFL